MIAGALHKLSTWNESDIVWPIISLVIFAVWIPVEYFRIRFGFKGNINGDHPEIVAFLFASAFVLPLSGVTFLSWLDEFRPALPHEFICIILNIAFLIAELVAALALKSRLSKTQSAALKLRIAPILDKNFYKKYAGSQDKMSVREIQLGMQRFDRERDDKPFRDSDKMLKDPKYYENQQLAQG
jgi:hypothetical protein